LHVVRCSAIFTDIAGREEGIWQRKMQQDVKNYLGKLKLLHNTTSMHCVVLGGQLLLVFCEEYKSSSLLLHFLHLLVGLCL